MLAATIVGPSPEQINSGKPQEITTSTTTQAISEKTKSTSLQNTKKIVEEYFSDTPIMIDIAKCESEFVQFEQDGSVKRGHMNNLDVGVMQINEKYHLDVSKKLGLDIYTTEGNLAYAKYLYKTQGTKPWKYSASCWNKNREVALAN